MSDPVVVVLEAPGWGWTLALLVASFLAGRARRGARRHATSPGVALAAERLAADARLRERVLAAAAKARAEAKEAERIASDGA